MSRTAPAASLRRTLLWMTLSAFIGAVTAVAVDRALFRAGQGAPAMHARAAGTAEPRVVAPPPPAPVDPEPARAALITLLTEAGVPPSGIEHGLYPLRGPGRPADATLPLVSFTCPAHQGCEALLSSLEAGVAASGYALARGNRPDDPQRPAYRALSRAGAPALAVRALPPGPRLTLVIDGVGDDPATLEPLIALDPHVTYGVLSSAAHATEAATRLSGDGREVIAHLPMDAGGAGAAGGLPPLTTEMSPEAVAEAARAHLARVPGAVGADNHQGARFTTSRAHVGAVLEVLRERALYFLDGGASPASVAQPAAQALGVRTAARTHRLEARGDALAAELRAVEAALVLEGHAVVIARPDAETLTALGPWLEGLRERNIHLLRLSEIVR